MAEIFRAIWSRFMGRWSITLVSIKSNALTAGNDKCKVCGLPRNAHPETHRFIEEE